MVLEDVLQSPLGLLALLSIVPLVVLYLVRPSPATMALPTFRFLVTDEGRDGRRRALERLRRELLFLLQLLVLVLVSLALAGPYVQVTRGVPADEVGLVVDASASMATGDEYTRREHARTEPSRSRCVRCNRTVNWGR